MAPFLHGGAGAFVTDGDPTPGLSFGVGIKAPLGRRIAVRIGVQDRIRLRDGSHRFDVYGGIAFRW